MSRRQSRTRKLARSKRASGEPRQPRDRGGRRPPSPNGPHKQDRIPRGHRRGRG